MFYCGIDLGSRKSQVCLITEDDRVICNVACPSDITSVRHLLEQHGGPSSMRIVAESTFNWDWLVDGLQEDGYDIILAHTLGMHAISHAKVKTDRRDAHTLAKLLKGGLIPRAGICPAPIRGFRDLLRKRWRLVADRAKEYRAIQLLLYRQGRSDLTLSDIKSLDTEQAATITNHPELSCIARHNLERIALLSGHIEELEERLRTGIGHHLEKDFKDIQTIPGIGFVYGLTITLETGDIHRFPDSRRYSSYCRVVPGCANSSGTEKRGRHSRQGNPYLKWAFMGAAQRAVCFDPHFKKLHTRYAKRHRTKAGKLKAYNTIAHRLAQVAFHILRDHTPYEARRLFPTAQS